MESGEKIVIICTAGPEDPEKATLPFVVATAAQSMDVEVSMIFQANAVMLCKKGEAENVKAKGLMPLKDLLDTYTEEKGKLLLCSPCVKERGIQPEEFVKGAEVIAAGTVVSEALSAKSVLNY